MKRKRSPSHSTEFTSSSPSVDPANAATPEDEHVSEEFSLSGIPSALHGLARTHTLRVREAFRDDPAALYRYLVKREPPTDEAGPVSRRGAHVSIDCHWAIPYGGGGYLPDDARAARDTVETKKTQKTHARQDEGQTGVWIVPPGWGVVTHHGSLLFLDHVAREAHDENPFSPR